MEACAKDGDHAACEELALWHSSGDFLPIDEVLSRKWLSQFETIAEEGNSEAQYELSLQFRFATLRPRNLETNCWLESAAELGYGEAQHNLAGYFERGDEGYPVNTEEAAKWYQLALEQRHPETLYTFACQMFENGTPTDEARQLLKEARDAGFEQAGYLLEQYSH